jgi:hypothetical protein
MTDINIAYSYSDDKEEFYTENTPKQSQQPPPQIQQQSHQSPPQMQQPSHQSPPQMQQPSYQPPQQMQYMMNKQMEKEKFMNMYNSGVPEYSFWDRMVLSRREVLKLFILALVVVIGISLEKIGCHYLTNYINSNDLTTIQELLVRFSFPILIILILWIIKSL